MLLPRNTNLLSVASFCSSSVGCWYSHQKQDKVLPNAGVVRFGKLMMNEPTAGWLTAVALQAI